MNTQFTVSAAKKAEVLARLKKEKKQMEIHQITLVPVWPGRGGDAERSEYVATGLIIVGKEANGLTGVARLGIYDSAVQEGLNVSDQIL